MASPIVFKAQYLIKQEKIARISRFWLESLSTTVLWKLSTQFEEKNGLYRIEQRVNYTFLSKL